MNLYRISQSVCGGWDTYDSAVVAAKTEDDAKVIHPSGRKTIHDEFSYDWAKKVEDVEAELIGKAVKGTEAGVIVASFNAG